MTGMFKGKKIAVTVGDPSGVGPEIIEAWATSDCCGDVEVIAHGELLSKLPDGVSKRRVGDSDFRAEKGVPCLEGARIALESLELAAEGCAEGRYSAVLTSPISKIQMRKVGFEFAGQTEFFAARWGGTPVMAFAGERLTVSLATWHDPLSKVSSLLTPEKIGNAVRAADSLVRFSRGVEEPRIAVCGLNPHAGEGGLMGAEEEEIINPALEDLRKEFPGLSVALPPDTVFMRALRGEFDSVVAMYHDQGLGPLKAVEFDSAVNVSMNLPYLRVSPDHGTGFSIAGKGIAKPDSFISALALARKYSGRFS